MNPSEQEIENALRHAPRHTPPANLRSQLMAQVKLPVTRSESRRTTPALSGVGWFRRWWPALVPGMASLVCMVVLAVQQMEIRDLRETLSQGPVVTETIPSVATSQTGNDTTTIDPS